MLTADAITDRILGVSKTATVSTRTLFLGSGNNVGPIRDLLRRVLTIHLDPRCATPATMTYKGFPVDKVRQRRSVYVAAVLTIIQAWRRAGSPRARGGQHCHLRWRVVGLLQVSVDVARASRSGDGAAGTGSPRS